MNDIFKQRLALKKKLRNREQLFAGWVSYAHPSITETFAMAGFDFMAIDMEHSTVSIEHSVLLLLLRHKAYLACQDLYRTPMIGLSPYWSLALME